MLRKYRFAGPNNFYSDQPSFLEKFFKENTSKDQENRKAFAAICPHAGYIFSAKTALMTLNKIQIPNKIVIIGPNHTGLGPPLSIMTNGDWEIPGHVISVDTNLADDILHQSTYLKDDSDAHKYEHSIEVILPLIYYFNPQFTFVPIIMRNYSSLYIDDLKNAIYKASLQNDNSFLLIASSDMSHFISRKEAKIKDEIAFEKIRNLDYTGLMEVVEKNHISMCGSGPVAVGLAYSKMKGAKKAKLINYTDSGYVTGDTQEIVSYAGFVVNE